MALSLQHQRLVRRLAAGSFHVIGLPDGEVSPEFTSRARAEAWLEGQLGRLKWLSAKRARACMCCTQTFDSDGLHNRLCATCRLASHDTQAFNFINPRRRTG